MIPKQNDKAWNGACQALQDTQKHFQKSKSKVMLVTFSDSLEISHKEFVSPGHMVNKKYYVEVLSCLVQRIRRIRPVSGKRKLVILA
jgi:hypothetical protein